MLLDTDPIGGRKVGQVSFAQFNLHSAPLRNVHGILNRFGDVLKQIRHLFGRAQILLLGKMSRPPRVIERSTIANTHTRLVRIELIRR